MRRMRLAKRRRSRPRNSSMAAYERVPTDESDLVDNQPVSTRFNFATFKKPLLISLAFCLAAVLSYKLGQWSVATPHPDVAHPGTNSTIGHDTPDPEISKPGKNETEMPGNGKYSVG